MLQLPPTSGDLHLFFCLFLSVFSMSKVHLSAFLEKYPVSYTHGFLICIQNREMGSLFSALSFSYKAPILALAFQTILIQENHFRRWTIFSLCCPICEPPALCRDTILETRWLWRLALSNSNVICMTLWKLLNQIPCFQGSSYRAAQLQRISFLCHNIRWNIIKPQASGATCLPVIFTILPSSLECLWISLWFSHMCVCPLTPTDLFEMFLHLPCPLHLPVILLSLKSNNPAWTSHLRTCLWTHANLVSLILSHPPKLPGAP